ncbi:hypothetical protein F5Y03DRAFT_392405 [Xylaria venustula]|nr:hypothetical protein F5Y03DRAFT_392405 [Xylaria venustula]
MGNNAALRTLYAQLDVMSQSQDNTHGSRSTSTPVSAATTQAEMAQAFRDLARGEQQAAAIEANLANIESKLDALLASIEGGAGEADEAEVEKIDKDSQKLNKERPPQQK